MATLKHYKSPYYEVDLPENHCIFCKHCCSIFWDYENGPYAFGCDLTEEEPGFCQETFDPPKDCPHFEPEEEEQ